MYATVRRYVGEAAFADKLAARKDDVLSLITGTPGFRDYYLIRAGDDTISVTVCDDEAGANRTNEAAAKWVGENMPGVSKPAISAGDVVVSG